MQRQPTPLEQIFKHVLYKRTKKKSIRYNTNNLLFKFFFVFLACVFNVNFHVHTYQREYTQWIRLG